MSHVTKGKARIDENAPLTGLHITAQAPDAQGFRTKDLNLRERRVQFVYLLIFVFTGSRCPRESPAKGETSGAKLIPEPVEAVHVDDFEKIPAFWEVLFAPLAQLADLDIDVDVRVIAGNDQEADAVRLALEIPGGIAPGRFPEQKIESGAGPDHRSPPRRQSSPLVTKGPPVSILSLRITGKDNLDVPLASTMQNHLTRIFPPVFAVVQMPVRLLEELNGRNAAFL